MQAAFVITDFCTGEEGPEAAALCGRKTQSLRPRRADRPGYSVHLGRAGRKYRVLWPPLPLPTVQPAARRGVNSLPVRFCRSFWEPGDTAAPGCPAGAGVPPALPRGRHPLPVGLDGRTVRLLCILKFFDFTLRLARSSFRTRFLF